MLVPKKGSSIENRNFNYRVLKKKCDIKDKYTIKDSIKYVFYFNVSQK